MILREIMMIGCVLLAAGVTASMVGSVCAQEQHSDPRILVLTNGNFVSGVISNEQDQTIVQTPEGSRLVFSKDQISFVCQSLPEAYWGKLARIKASDTEAQVKLFRWCLQNRLLELAQNQIDILQASPIKASQLEYLYRQLEVARRTEYSESMADVTNSTNSADSMTQRQAELSLAANPASGDHFDEIDPVFQPLPMLSTSPSLSIGPSLARQDPDVVYKSIRSPEDPQRSEVIQVGYSEPMKDIATGNPGDLSQLPGARPPVPSVRELDQLTRSMPRGSLAVFRQQVENVFVRSCSTCHTQDSKAMPLMHAGRLQAISRRMSQRNLHSILRYADRLEPARSIVLSFATTAHGGADVPSLEPGSSEHLALANWLVMISQNPESAAESMKLELRSVLPSENQVRPVKPEPAGIDPDSRPLSELGPAQHVENSDLQPSDTGYRPRDEFDPELFNRKHGDSDK